MSSPTRLTALQYDCVRAAAFMPLKREHTRYIAVGGRGFSSRTVDSLKVHGLLRTVYMGADTTDDGRALAETLKPWAPA